MCFAASTAAAFVTVPVLEFLAALFLLFAYSTKFNERFKGFLWPLMVSHWGNKTQYIFFPFFLMLHLNCFFSFQGFHAMCDCLHYLFHHLHNCSVQIRRRFLQGCWGKTESLNLILAPSATVSVVHSSLYFLCVVLNVLLFTDIWVHRHHRVRSRFLPHL